MNKFKEEVASQTIDKDTSLEEICQGADVLIGLSSADAFEATIMKGLNKDPIVFALANPEPEIYP